MMKKLFNWTLMAALVVGLGTTVTACSDDDNDEKEQRNADADTQDTDENQVAWRWLCAMTDAKTMDGNWASKTYQPTIGEPSENNKLNRLVIVSSIDEARKNFADMADMEVSQLANAQTIDVKGVGRLTWTPSAANAQNLAEVTVDTKLIPGLQKIIYCTEEQRGENGMFSDNIKGVAYYRFGDVIYKNGYYWVCVRPCHEVGDKGKSHWINIFNAQTNSENSIPDANLYTKYNKKYNDKTIIFPTKLKYKREHIHNLANLVYAILNPEGYTKVVGSSGKECLGELPYEYVSESFLKKVANYWSSKKEDGKNIWQLLFNMDKTELENKVLNFYYQGYSWVWGDEATLWCYSQGKYENVIHGSESGDKVSYKVKNEGFDIQRYAFYKKADKEAGHAQTVGNNAYWVIRYATGEDLTGDDGTVTPVSGIPNSKDVYRFYHEKNIQAGTTWEKAKVYDGDIPVYDDNKDVLGYIFGLDRHLYKTCKEARQEGSTPVAIVCYAGDKPSDSGAPTFTRLAIGLENAYDEHVTALMQWGPTGQICSSKPFPESEYSQMVEQLNGYSVTEALINDDHNHRPAIVCNQYFQITKDDMTFVDYYGWLNLHTTHWFMPSAGQWALFLKSLGVWENRQKGSEVIKAINKFYEDAGVETQYRILTNGEGMWTSTEVDKDKAWVVKIDEQNGFRFEAVSKSALNTVFPFIMIYPRTARYQQ